MSGTASAPIRKLETDSSPPRRGGVPNGPPSTHIIGARARGEKAGNRIFSIARTFFPMSSRECAKKTLRRESARSERERELWPIDPGLPPRRGGPLYPRRVTRVTQYRAARALVHRTFRRTHTAVLAFIRSYSSRGSSSLLRAFAFSFVLVGVGVVLYYYY